MFKGLLLTAYFSFGSVFNACPTNSGVHKYTNKYNMNVLHNSYYPESYDYYKKVFINDTVTNLASLNGVEFTFNPREFKDFVDEYTLGGDVDYVFEIDFVDSLNIGTSYFQYKVNNQSARYLTQTISWVLIEYNPNSKELNVRINNNLPNVGSDFSYLYREYDGEILLDRRDDYSFRYQFVNGYVPSGWLQMSYYQLDIEVEFTANYDPLYVEDLEDLGVHQLSDSTYFKAAYVGSYYDYLDIYSKIFPINASNFENVDFDNFIFQYYNTRLDWIHDNEYNPTLLWGGTDSPLVPHDTTNSYIFNGDYYNTIYVEYLESGDDYWANLDIDDKWYIDPDCYMPVRFYAYNQYTNTKLLICEMGKRGSLYCVELGYRYYVGNLCFMNYNLIDNNRIVTVNNIYKNLPAMFNVEITDINNPGGSGTVSLLDSLNLISLTFGYLSSFLSVAILPGITIGALIFAPVVASIIIIVFKFVSK